MACRPSSTLAVRGQSFCGSRGWRYSGLGAALPRVFPRPLSPLGRRAAGGAGVLGRVDYGARGWGRGPWRPCEGPGARARGRGGSPSAFGAEVRGGDSAAGRVVPDSSEHAGRFVWRRESDSRSRMIAIGGFLPREGGRHSRRVQICGGRPLSEMPPCKRGAVDERSPQPQVELRLQFPFFRNTFAHASALPAGGEGFLPSGSP